MAKHLITWTDEEGNARVRAVEGTIAEAERALQLLQQTHESYGTMRLIEDVDFVPLSAIEEEFVDVTGNPLP